MTTNPHVADVKQLINDLIQAGTSFDIGALERIYHNDLQVIMLDPSGATSIADKAMFKGLFQSKRDNKEPALNTWAEFHRIDADDKNAHVLISRKVKLMAEEQKITLSIDLVKENNAWQVMREVIFVHAEDK
ncbi:hypothetical protein [Colwellia sp. UCD-KL20]|uniref:hypothetical protein n=1 Tax=Colwellia sp. UCD-KL20 TaxID=1917165 RepID=UPI0009709ADD|nr:hypothetical protein [Colwellia sp. UCD-KL20]